MGKSRAQRKAEKRARELEEAAQARGEEAQAQHDTQVPKSGDVAEVEAVEAGIAAGARDPEIPEGRGGTTGLESKQDKRQKRQEEKQRKVEQKQREEQQLAKRQKQAQGERKKGGVGAFLSSSAAELKRVQWPDRDTLIQATAVTLVFVLLFSIYLGLLDQLFGWLVKQLL